ncbi:hypothetical protein ABZV91_12845 [Nocardia sp. NPDC004568]|uniref:hypothetical protein n=1 Tax=Nocardia sp. NPDC004568 TaxID=3154551 RepID=UPI0033B5A4C5
MSTFIDQLVLDLRDGADPQPVLAALRRSGVNAHLWLETLPGGSLRLMLYSDSGELYELPEFIIEATGHLISRILVENNGDEYGAELVVLAEHEGRFVRTLHLKVDGEDRPERGDYDQFPVDEGLNDDWYEEYDLVYGPEAGKRTAAAYGVAAEKLESDYRIFDANLCTNPAFGYLWRALDIWMSNREPDLTLGNPAH